MIEQGKMEQAYELLTSFLPPSEDYDPIVFFLLGKGYQSQEDHEQAMTQLEVIARQSPEFLKDSTFRKVVKFSEKRLGRRESILPKKWFGLFGECLETAFILHNYCTRNKSPFPRIILFEDQQYRHSVYTIVSMDGEIRCAELLDILAIAKRLNC